MFIIKRIIILLQERWKYLLGWYIIGYFTAIMQSGVPNLSYLIPLKVYAVVSGWAMGNAHYKVMQQVKKKSGVMIPMHIKMYYGVKYGLSGLLIMIIYCVIISSIGVHFNFDVAPFFAPVKL